MADLRLAGRTLAMARTLAESSTTRGTLWRVVRADFHVSDLETLPESMLGKVEEVPAPVVGAPPRSWGGGTDLGVPTTTRCTGHSLREAYAAGATDPVEVLQRVLQHQREGTFGQCTHSPFVCVDPEVALGAAEASRARWAAGGALGALDGLPVPIKDEFHMAGLPTYGGTSWRTALETGDAELTTQLRQAGAVLPGKSHATEFGLNPLGYNVHFDMPRNVYSSAHGAGGSSTGSAAAVGLGLATVAVGTDGGGSIRVPAAMNGVFGLKPTFNRFSGVGDIWVGTVGHAGPIGQSASDLVDLLEGASGRDPRDPLTHFALDWDAVRPTWRAAIGRGIAGCRIGVLVDELADADPAIAAACRSALDALAADGATLVDVRIPHLPIVNAIGPIVIASESAANTAGLIAQHRDETGDELRLIYGLMKSVSAPMFLKASRARTGIRARAAAALAGVDVLALPTQARTAAPYALSEGDTQLSRTAWTAAMTRFSFLGNLTGLPAGSAPVAMCEGLPVGLQIVGDAFDEASVLAVLAHLERLGVTALPLPPDYVDLRQ